jgi:hypothetical protein
MGLLMMNRKEEGSPFLLCFRNRPWSSARLWISPQRNHFIDLIQIFCRTVPASGKLNVGVKEAKVHSELNEIAKSVRNAKTEKPKYFRTFSIHIRFYS